MSADQKASLEPPVTPCKISSHLAKYAFASPGPSTPRASNLRPTRPASSTPVKRELRSCSPESPNPRSESTPKAKYSKKPRPYANPEVYKHLRPVNDHLGPGLEVVFCGINPGKRSAIDGHHYANPTNRFWKCLHGAGFTDRLVDPSEDFTLPERYKLGLTNLVDRPTAEQAELSTLEMRQSVPALLAKLDKHRPMVLCFVGKKIWEAFESVIIKTVDGPRPEASARVKAEIGSPARRTRLSRAPSRSSVTLLKLDENGQVENDEIKPQRPPKSPRTPKKEAAQWSWHEPRPYKYQLESGGFCYFWVVPSTSGLERTLIGEKIEHFKAVHTFAQQLRAGHIEPERFQTVVSNGIADVVATYEDAAAKRAASASAKAEL